MSSWGRGENVSYKLNETRS